MGFFSFLKSTTSSWWSSVKSIFSSSDNFDDILDSLEEMLILGDVGVETTDELLNKIKVFIKNERDCTPEKIYDKLVECITEIVSIDCEDFDCSKNNLNVIVVLGVNGVGKTTSIAKIANLFKKKYKVLIGGGDTFRAAAGSQLRVLCDKINVDLVCGNDGESPSTVAYKTLDSAVTNGYNLVILDTAGRLHNKQNLMNELNKMNRSISNFITNEKAIERWLVIDGTMGQNIFRQIEEFNKVTKITGFIVTKADSISKFGFIIGIINKYKVPIRYVGIGEKIDDLTNFNSKAFIEDLLKK